MGLSNRCAIGALFLLALCAAPVVVKASVHRPGILLWSWGRCGTGTMWETLRETAATSGYEINAVCGRKEGMSRGSLNKQRFDDCLARIPKSSAWFLHVKPKFLNDELSDVKGLINLSMERGAKVMVVIERSNWLARDVSGITKHWVARLQEKGEDYTPTRCHRSHVISNMDCPGKCVEQFDEYQRMVEEGVKWGKKLGIRVVRVRFDHNNWPCGGIEEVLKAAVEEGVFPTLPDPICVQKNQHFGDERHDPWGIRHASGDLPLEKRVGLCTARAFEMELKGTKHEWMLDLSRDVPPGMTMEEDL